MNETELLLRVWNHCELHNRTCTNNKEKEREIVGCVFSGDKKYREHTENTKKDSEV